MRIISIASHIDASRTIGTQSEHDDRVTHRGLTLNHIRWWIARLSHPHLAEIYAPDTPDASLSEAKKAAEKFIDAIQCAEASGDGVTELEQRQWAELTTLTKILIDKDPKKEW